MFRLGGCILDVFRTNQLWLFVGAYFALLPIGKTLWLPLIIMAALGLIAFFKERSQWVDVASTQKLFFIAACFYVPALLSMSDSLVQSRTLIYLSFYPLLVAVGFYILRQIVKRGPSISGLLVALTVITLFWSAATFWQFVSPADNPFGRPVGGRFQGVFGQKNMVLGYVLVPLLPLLAYGYWAIGKKKTALLVSLVLITTCLLSGNRASWVSVIVATGAVPVLALLAGWRPSLRAFSGFLVGSVFVIFSVASLISDTSVERRISNTLSFFESPSFETFEQSFAKRGEIWLTAVKIGVDNPFNGVGVDNFRYAHPYYAPEGNVWRRANTDETGEHKYTGAMYAHQIVLQQFAGAGVPGILGLLVFYLILGWLTVRVSREKNLLAMGAVLAVWIGYFPLNTHLNFHGAWLSSNFWVLIGLMLGFASRFSKQELAS